MSKTHNAGIVTAYGAAVRGGYTGTYEEFCTQQAQYAENARRMEQAVSDVRQIKTSVESAVSEAEGYANNANQSATNASNSATQASESASNANQSAESVSQFADNASNSANSASQSAASAQTSATNASTSEQNARQSAETAQDVLDSVQAEGNTQINRVQSEGNTQIGRVQAKGNEILNSLPSDFTQVQNDIASLNGSLDDVKADLSDIGALKIYRSSTAEYKVYFQVDANVPIVFKPISTATAGTRMNLYGINDDDTYTRLLGQIPLNNTVIVTPTAVYKGIRVITSPYNDVPFSFGFVQNVNGFEYRVDMLQDIVDTAKSNTDALSNILFSGHHKLNGSGNIVADYTSVSQGEVYRFYAWNVAGMLANNPVVYVIDNNNIPTNMLSVKTTYKNGFYWQITVPENTKSLRFYANKASNVDYAECEYAVVKVQGTMIDLIHDRLDTKTDKMSMFNKTTCKIFKRVVCCGDSYTAGYTNVGGVLDPVNEEFAWPHYMATLTGNEYVNCGASGTTVLTWQSHERGLAKAQAAGYAQAYIVGLMINDVGTSEPVGTTDDIGTEAQTFYGGMSKIIRELNAISETAKIFVLTCPNTAPAYTPYNQAVRDIVTAYAEAYPVHLIDLYAMRDLFSNASLTGDAIGGHYTAVGYEQFAEIMSYVISDYINHHVSDFQNIHKIPYLT